MKRAAGVAPAARFPYHGQMVRKWIRTDAEAVEIGDTIQVRVTCLDMTEVRTAKVGAITRSNHSRHRKFFSVQGALICEHPTGGKQLIYRETSRQMGLF